MSKAIKTAVKVFAITFTLGMALTVLPFINFTAVAMAEFAALSAVGTLVGGLLSKGIDATRENFGTKVATRSATNPRQIIYGKARVGGTITHIETSGTDKYKLSMIVVLAGHEVESLEEVLINDEVLTTTSNGGYEYATNTRFTNSDNDNKFSVQNSLLRYVFLDGSQTTANNNVISNTSLGNTDKFIGISYIFVEMVFDSEAFGGGIPPMSFVVKGKKVFDPRDSSTAWSDNPALCVRDYITDTTYGLKATSSEVNDSTALGSFKVAANTCEGNQPITTATVSGAVTASRIVNLAIADTVTLIDVGQKVTGTGISGNVYVSKRTGTQLTLTANVSLANGTTLTFTEMAYTANGITNMSADGGGVIEGLLSSCAGKLSYIDGKFVMFAGANVTPNMTITDDNLLAPITVQTAQSSGETFNSVKAVYVDANNNYVATDSPLYEDSTLLANDTPSGESSANYKKSLEIQLPFTDTTTMAQRLQRTALLHTRQKTSLSVSCNIAFMQLQPFDWVYLTNERLGYTNKTFEVLSTNLEVIDQDGVPVLATRLDLKEINSSVYNFASSSYTNPLDEGSSVSTGSFAVSPPTSLAVATTLEITGFDLNVSWTNNPDDLVQGTEVFYGTTSGTYIGSFIVGKSTAKESINGVKASTTYYVAVRHFSSNNVFSALTSEVSVTTGTAPISYSTGGGNVGGADTLNVLGKNLVLNRFNSTSGGEDNENYTFLNSGNGALGGITSFQNSDTERVQLFFGEDIGGDFTNQFIALDADWDLGKGGSNGSSTGTSKLIIKGRAYGSSTGSAGATSTIATFNAITNTDGYAFPTVELAPTTISGSTTTPVVVVSQGSAPSTTTNKLYNVGGSLYWNGAVVDTGAGDITGVTITTSGQSGLTGGASFASGDATFTLAIASTINGSKTFSDNVVIQGNLDVQGTTTTIDTTNLDVKDKNITLNYGSGDTSANANGAGITIQDAVSASQNATILWNTSANAFKFSHKIRLDDNIQAQFGSGADLRIYHNGTDSTIENNTGDLYITNKADDKDIIFRSDDGSGGYAVYFKLDGSEGRSVASKDIRFEDGIKSTYGNSDDLQIYHDGSNSWIKDAGTGDLVVRSSTNIFLQDATGANNYAKFTTNAVELRHNNDVRFTTTGTGIEVTGTVTSDGLTSSQTINVNSASGSVDSRIAFNNSVKNGWIGIPSWDNTSLRIYGTSPTSGNTNEPAAMYRDGAWSFWTDYNNTSGNGSTSTALFISTGGSLNVGRGDIQIGGTTVISSSRNLSNIASYNGYTPTKSSSSTNSVTSLDSRNVNSSPSARDKGLYVDFKTQSTISLTGSGSYAGVLTFRSYGSGTDLSGGYPIQIAYDQAGNLQTRYGSSSSAWGSWKAIHLAGNNLSAGNITVTGTVDGRDIATDGTKLDGIEAGATTDQTQAEINALGITAIGLSGTPDITVGTINSGAIDVTGTATMDGLTVNSGGTSSNISIRNSGSSFLNIYADTNGVALLDVDANNAGGAPRFQVDVGGVQALRITEGNDIYFYEDTGSTAKFFWDASAEKLGIGTTTVGAALTVHHALPSGNYLAEFRSTGNSHATIDLRADGTGDPRIFFDLNGATPFAIGVDNSDGDKFKISGHYQLGTNDRFVIDSSGNSTFSGTISSGSVTAGSSGNSAFLRAYYGSDYMTLQGYGLEMNRAASYIRPTTDGNKTLYIGGTDASLDWAAIHFRSLLGLYMTGTQFLTTDRNLVNIGTISSDNITVNTTSSGNQITLQAPTPSIEFIDSQATSRKAKISAENGNLLFEADTNTGEANTAITFKMDGANALSFNNSKNANFANDVSVTNELNVGQQITASGGITTDQTGQTISGFTTIRVGDALIGQDVATLTTTATTQTNRILASATTYRTIKVLVQIKSSTNFHATEILLTHNGSTVYMTEYATIFSNNSLATFDADISGGNIRLLIDPNQSASTEFKFNVSGIEA